MYYDITMVFPYEKDGTPIDARWSMDFGPTGMFASKLYLSPYDRAILKRALVRKVLPSYKGPNHPKTDGVMSFRRFPSQPRKPCLRGQTGMGSETPLWLPIRGNGASCSSFFPFSLVSLFRNPHSHVPMMGAASIAETGSRVGIPASPEIKSVIRVVGVPATKRHSAR